jgi:hypothetical protein
LGCGRRGVGWLDLPAGRMPHCWTETGSQMSATGISLMHVLTHAGPNRGARFSGTDRGPRRGDGPAEGHQPGRVTSGKTGINLSRPALLPSRPPVAHRRCRGGAARCSQPLSSSQRVSLSAAAHRTAPAAPRARTTRGSHRPTSGENLVTWPT